MTEENGGHAGPAAQAAVRAWFDKDGWRLEPADLQAALAERGCDEDTIVLLIDEGADRRRAQPVMYPDQSGTSGFSASDEERKPEVARRNGRHLAPVPDPPPNVPPQNLEAEESVLGAMMLSPGAVAACSEILQPDGSEFYRESHARIWRAALHLYANGEPVDKITMIDRLEEAGDLEQAGGRVRIHELAALVPATANAAHYARIVKETATLRSLIRGGGEIARLGWERPGSTEELVDRAGSIIYGLATGNQQAALEHGQVALRTTFQRISDLYESGSEIIGTATGFRDVDRVTSGLEPGNLFVVGARPSMGKSGFALAAAANIAIGQQLPVAVFSLEMSKAEIVQRLLSRQAHVDLQRIRTGRLQPDDWPRLTHAAGSLETAPLYLRDTDISVLTIRTELRRLKARQPNLALAIVDYLQLMTQDAENRTQEISKISRGLKLIARDLDIPILALSQLNRAVEQRHDKRPQLSDLRESGSVEQDADLVAFLYRDGYYNPETAEPTLTELILAKHRNGPTDTIKLSFVKKEATFTDTERMPFS